MQLTKRAQCLDGTHCMSPIYIYIYIYTLCPPFIFTFTFTFTLHVPHLYSHLHLHCMSSIYIYIYIYTAVPRLYLHLRLHSMSPIYIYIYIYTACPPFIFTFTFTLHVQSTFTFTLHVQHLHTQTDNAALYCTFYTQSNNAAPLLCTIVQLLLLLYFCTVASYIVHFALCADILVHNWTNTLVHALHVHQLYSKQPCCTPSYAQKYQPCLWNEAGGPGVKGVCALGESQNIVDLVPFSREQRYFGMSNPSDHLRILLVKAIVLAIAAQRPRYQLENMILAQILSSQKHNTNTCQKYLPETCFL